MDKAITLLALGVAAVFLVRCAVLKDQDRAQACAARQCPTSYTPTLTRDGCVCLMKAK